MDTDDKNVRDAALLPIMDKIAEEYPDLSDADLDLVSYKMQKYVVRRWLLDEGKRVDGRGINEIRPLAAEVGILPRVHGSGMFTRGQTQVLTTCTLGGTKDNQLMDDLTDEQTKRYIHHYNFPPYSVGEARAPRSPGRREIGHGALAERALVPVLPSLEEFPYTIRCVSEVLSSNGSTSQASICGSTLALMDAGVPIKAPVAGISCGLITEGDRWMTMLDIQGVAIDVCPGATSCSNSNRTRQRESCTQLRQRRNCQPNLLDIFPHRGSRRFDYCKRLSGRIAI